MPASKSTMEDTSPKPGDAGAERFVFVDGLRAVAALMVMAYHMIDCTVMALPLASIMPENLQILWTYGMHGVQIFFVISGFVIAHSLRNVEPTGKEIGNFIVRRQLRLDPPYWLTMAAILLLRATEGHFLGLKDRGAFGPGVVGLNMLYLQNLTGITQIVGVGWTLCLEIQFYLVFILIMALARKISQAHERGVAAVLVFGLGLVSLAVSPDQPNVSIFLPFWFYFAAGVLCYWCVKGGLRPILFMVFAILMLVTMLVQRRSPGFLPEVLNAEWVGLATALALFWAGRTGHLADWLGGRAFRYFGRISYSLYLVHFPLVSLVTRAGYKLTGPNPWLGICWNVVGAIMSVASADLFFRMVEQPSMRLAARFKRRPAPVVRPQSVIAAETGAASELNPVPS